MEYWKHFKKHIENEDLPAITALWYEYCLSEDIDVDESIQILKKIEESSLKESFGPYVEEILFFLDKIPEGDKQFIFLKHVFNIQTTNTKRLAQIAIDYLEKKYGTDPLFKQKLRLVGLAEQKNFEGSLANFESLMHMKRGNFFLHTSGWGVGEVLDVSMLREQITLEFDYAAGHKEFSFKNAFKNLVPVPTTHFLARRFGDPEKFEEFAKKNPTETIHILLRDLGPKTALEIKEEMEELVIPQKEWSRWWQMTRSRLKKDTLVVTPTDPKKPFYLNDSEISHEQRLEEDLSREDSTKHLIETTYAFVRDFASSLKKEDFKKWLIEKLTDTLSQKKLTDSQEIQILLLLQDVGHLSDDAINTIIEKIHNPEEFVNKVPILAYKKRLLQKIQQIRPDWKPIFASLLFSINQNSLRDYILDVLLQNDGQSYVEDQIQSLLENPTLSPSTFCWYFQKIMKEEGLPLSTGNWLSLFLEAAFTLLYAAETSLAKKDIVKKLYQQLTHDNFYVVRTIFKTSEIDSVSEVLLLATKSQTLNNHDLKILHSLAEVVHPSLSQWREEEEEEEVLWATPEGYQKVKDRIEEIANVETLANAKEIEIARSYGDLRENSEYKFALEKKSRLQSELRFLSSQIKKMRILTRDDIDTSVAGIGTRIFLKNATDETREYILLGPWDAKPEENILSVQSKIGQALTGLSVGDPCSIQEQEWTVMKIESYL